jgi:hypothetical protein
MMLFEKESLGRVNHFTGQSLTLAKEVEVKLRLRPHEEADVVMARRGTETALRLSGRL